MRILDAIGQRFKVSSRVSSDKAFAQKSSDQAKQAYISKRKKYSLKLKKERGGGGSKWMHEKTKSLFFILFYSPIARPPHFCNYSKVQSFFLSEF